MSEINFCNTKEQLNHLGEVVTGKTNGSPSGANIETSTLPYTGQVRKTLPALEGEYEQSITNKESEADAVIDTYRLLNKGPYAAGITLESKFEYITYNGESYFATNPPYTTTATTPDADGNLFVGGYATQDFVDSGFKRSFDSVQDAVGNCPDLGYSLTVDDYYGGSNPNDSGVLFFKVVPAGTGVDDGGKYIDVDATRQLEQNLQLPVRPRAYGADPYKNRDSTLNIQRALDLGLGFLGQAGTYRITDTIRHKVHGNMFDGGSGRFVLFADNLWNSGDPIPVPAVITFDNTITTAPVPRTRQPVMKNIRISGNAHTAFVIAECTGYTCENLTLENGQIDSSGFVGEHGFVWESSFDGTNSNLQTAGTTLNVPFAFYRTVLDSKFDLLYTSNLSLHSFYLNYNVRKYSVNTDLGNGNLHFTLPTMQGASSYAWAQVGFTNVTVDTPYLENVGAHYYFSSDNTRDTVVRNSEITSFGTPQAGGVHSTWVGGSLPTSGTSHAVKFEDCTLGEGEFVLDGIFSRCAIDRPFLYSNRLIENQIKRGPNCLVTVPLSVDGTSTSNGNEVYSMKPAGYNLYAMSIIKWLSTYDRAEFVLPATADATPYTVYAGGL